MRQLTPYERESGVMVTDCTVYRTTEGEITIEPDGPIFCLKGGKIPTSDAIDMGLVDPTEKIQPVDSPEPEAEEPRIAMRDDSEEPESETWLSPLQDK